MVRKILVVDDDEDVRSTLELWLTREGYEVRTVARAESAFGVLEEFRPEVMVTDIYMPGLTGLELLARVREAGVDLDVIVITGQEGLDTAVEAMRTGAYDYLSKPVDPGELGAVLERCFEDRRARDDMEPAGGAGSGETGQLIGSSRPMIQIYKTVGRVAGTRAPVLIRGETGTGKEVVARAIHGNSPDADEPFVAINCTAVPEQLLESELFGHVKGAFTGAVGDRRGRFELAGRGTVFLDEIGDTAPTFQAKLLRVLQEHEFYPVGGEEPRRTEARVLAATHRPIESLVRDGAFREDLYFRLRVVEIHIPPLRERADDIPELAEFFLARAARSLGRPSKMIPTEVMHALQEHEWRGNVRELENCIARAVVLSQGPTIRLEHLGIGANGETGEEGGEGRPGLVVSSLDEAERRQVVRILERTGGNKRQAAEILEISRPRLDRLIKKHDIDIADLTGAG
jgi:two-component system response regulator HydG